MDSAPTPARPSSLSGLVALVVLAALCLPAALAVSRVQKDERIVFFEGPMELAAPTRVKVSTCWRLDVARLRHIPARVIFVGAASLAADSEATIVLDGGPKDADGGGIVIMRPGSDEMVGFYFASSFYRRQDARQPEPFKPSMCGTFPLGTASGPRRRLGPTVRLPAGRYEAIPFFGRLPDLEVGGRTPFEVVAAGDPLRARAGPLPSCGPRDAAIGIRVRPSHLQLFPRRGAPEAEDSILELVVLHLSDRPCRVYEVATVGIENSTSCDDDRATFPAAARDRGPMGSCSPRRDGQLLARMDARLPADHMRVQARWEWLAANCPTPTDFALTVEVEGLAPGTAFKGMCPGRPRLSRL